MKQSETIFINRSKIQFAAYNPRKKDKKVIDSLKKNFKKVGFMGGIIWNKTTSNLVGGHKRVETLDLINGYDGTIETDYELKVECVELDLKTEKEQNIYLNNKKQQGETDFELMAVLIEEINIDNAGLDIQDIEIIEALVPDFEFGRNDEIKKDIEELSYEDRKANMKRDIKGGISESQQSTHFTITFRSYDDKAEFLESIGINGDDTIITSDKFLKRLNDN